MGNSTKVKGRKILKLRGLGETVPFISAFHEIKEEVSTQVDLAKFAPTKTVTKREAPGKNRKVTTMYGSPIKQTFIRNTKERKKQRRITNPVFDPISALYHLRSIRLPTGKKIPLTILTGNNLFKLELKVVGKERIYTPNGPRNAIRIDGLAQRIRDDGKPITNKKPRKVSLWLSANRARVPLKLTGDTKLGPIEANISTYKPPKRRLRIRAISINSG